jgi:hypothetical protein
VVHEGKPNPVSFEAIDRSTSAQAFLKENPQHVSCESALWSIQTPASVDALASKAAMDGRPKHGQLGRKTALDHEWHKHLMHCKLSSKVHSTEPMRM